MSEINRPLEIAAFLDQNRWEESAIQPLDGDFSTRRYARLAKADGRTALLMDADSDQKTLQFVAIAKILRKTGLQAPEIYAASANLGLALLQDFGTRNVGGLLDAGEEAIDFYLRAAEILAHLHRYFDRNDAQGLDLPLYTAELFATQAELFLDHYFPFALRREASDEERGNFHAAWLATLRPVEIMPKSLLLRDFMPDNLMDLPNGELGVLDFQDAGIGPVAYDLASLCENVRRDGGFGFLPEVVAHYRAALTQAGGENVLSQSDLLRACTLLSAQRHTRIMGIIAQLALEKRRRDKLAFLPRIRLHLNTILKEPYLLPVWEWMESTGVLSIQIP
ncbi:MAG: phosphotransferase [Alphaproteobacteria bacterium]